MGVIMVLLAAHPWIRFATGLITGCWIGVFVGAALTLLLAGRRMRELDLANRVLRIRLKARERQGRSGTGRVAPILVMPPGAFRRSASAPPGRAAHGGR